MRLTPHQTSVLKKSLLNNGLSTKEQRCQVATKLGITYNKVTNWFYRFSDKYQFKNYSSSKAAEGKKPTSTCKYNLTKYMYRIIARVICAYLLVNTYRTKHFLV